MTGAELARIMDRPAQAISQIMTGKKQITPETAVQLEAALEIDSGFWMSLETNYPSRARDARCRLQRDRSCWC